MGVVKRAPQPHLYYSIKTVAERLGTYRLKVKELIHTLGIPLTKIGQAYVLTPDDYRLIRDLYATMPPTKVMGPRPRRAKAMSAGRR